MKSFITLLFISGAMASQPMSWAESNKIPTPPPPRPLKPIVNPQTNNATQATVAEKTTGRIKPSPKTSQEQQKPFAFSSVPLRNEPKTGPYVALLGGANFLQDSSTPYRQASNITSGNKTTNQLDDQQIGDPLAAIKFGYTWNFDEVGIDFIDRNDWIVGMGAEIEFIYNHQILDGFNLLTADERMRVEFDNLHTMFNLITVFQKDLWRPYLGVGVGFVYMMASEYEYVYSGGSFTAPDDETFEFSAQAFLGLDYFISKNISLFAEYKVIGISSINIYDGVRTEATSGPEFDVEADIEIGSFMNHYMTLGLKTYF